MKRIATALIALSLLAGCGQAGPTAARPAAKKATTAAAAKTSAATIEKGTLGMFKIAHAHLDMDSDGVLSPEEFARQEEEEVLPGLPGFAKLDKDGDGAVTLAEFTDKALLKTMTAIFTDRAGKAFAELDANKDKSLSAAEMKDADVTFAAADADKNKKVTQVELEAALAAALAQGAS